MCPRCGETDPAKMLGVQVQGVYDGILVWQCLACGHAWPRFEAPGRLYDAAVELISRGGGP